MDDNKNIETARSAIKEMIKTEKETEEFFSVLDDKKNDKKDKDDTEQITLTYNPDDFDGTEETFWKKAAEDITKYNPPVLFQIIYGDESVRVSVRKDYEPRVQGELKLKKCLYPKAWYQKVDIETNEYQFFKVIPYNLGKMSLYIGGSYGRIGATKRDLDHERFIKTPYASSMYWVLIKYLEKNGYTDMSDILFEEEAKEKPVVTEIEDSVAVKLYNMLQNYSRDALVRQVANVNFLSQKPPYTKAQVNKAWRIWKELAKSKDVKSFNDRVLKLIEISPRKVDKYRNTLQSLLAEEVDDPVKQREIFAAIIDREESLIRAMEAVAISSKSTPEKDAVSPFGNINVRMATSDEFEDVKKRMSNELKGKVKNIYAITPYKQLEKFNKYVEKREIEKTKLLWHGSRNENWISIIINSLMLNPNAVITGKMWGYGIYFAPSSMKSWGYTSYNGTRWAGGTSNVAFMGLYETAYGNPYLPTKRVNGTKKMLDSMNPKADCLHAKASVCGLYQDEIIYYDEDAICLRYLVEFSD